jgi:hypothetical protein
MYFKPPQAVGKAEYCVKLLNFSHEVNRLRNHRPHPQLSHANRHGPHSPDWDLGIPKSRMGGASKCSVLEVSIDVDMDRLSEIAFDAFTKESGRTGI